MNELQVDAPPRHYIRIKSSNITRPNIQSDLDSRYPTTFTPQQAEGLHKEIMEKTVAGPFIKEALKPNPQLAFGIQLARDSVNDLRQKIRLSPVDKNRMTVLLLNPENYRRLHDSSVEIDGDHIPVAFTAHGLDSVVMEDDDLYPNYLKASIACHEFVHKWLERQTHVFSNDVEKTQTNYRNRFLLENRRSGLQTSSLRVDGQHVRTGEILNELGNYYVQKIFIDNLLTDPLVFNPEIKLREEKLKQFLDETGFPDDGERISFIFDLDTLTGQQEFSIKFDKTNVHFAQNGESLLTHIQFYYIQLASDLARICGDTDGKFGELLVEAKSNPMLENTLKATIDAHMGNGFYDKIRNTPDNLENLAGLLVEVQSKLYPTTPS